MACCENNECIKFFVNDCVENINTTLVANATGAWKMFVEFNGVWKKIPLELTAGQAIVVPNIFNSNYKHNVEIFQPDGQLFNDTCYLFDMCLTIDATVEPNAAVITTDVNFIFKDDPDLDAGDGSVTSPYQLQAGNTVSIPLLGLQKVHFPIAINTGLEYIPYTPSTQTFNRSANGGFIDNDFMTISYEKTV